MHERTAYKKARALRLGKRVAALVLVLAMAPYCIPAATFAAIGGDAAAEEAESAGSRAAAAAASTDIDAEAFDAVYTQQDVNSSTLAVPAKATVLLDGVELHAQDGPALRVEGPGVTVYLRGACVLSGASGHAAIELAKGASVTVLVAGTHAKPVSYDSEAQVLRFGVDEAEAEAEAKAEDKRAQNAVNEEKADEDATSKTVSGAEPKQEAELEQEAAGEAVADDAAADEAKAEEDAADEAKAAEGAEANAAEATEQPANSAAKEREVLLSTLDVEVSDDEGDGDTVTIDDGQGEGTTEIDTSDSDTGDATEDEDDEDDEEDDEDDEDEDDEDDGTDPVETGDILLYGVGGLAVVAAAIGIGAFVASRKKDDEE